MEQDGGTLRASTVIWAPAEVVYDLVADVRRMGDWSPETVRAEWLDGATGPVVGARFRGTNRRGVARWSTTCEVIAADRGREFAFAVGGAAKPATVWRYRLEPGDGGTNVEESCHQVQRLSRAARLVTRLFTGVRDRDADLVAGMTRTLAALKAAAERQDVDTPG